MQELKTDLPAISDGMTKSEVRILSEKVVNNVMEGEVSSLAVAEGLSAMELFVKEMRGNDMFVNSVRDEVSKHPKGALVRSSGAAIENCEAGVSYDYSATDRWRDLDAQIKELAEEKKKLETMLRTIPAGKQMADPDTGEIYFGPWKKSTSTYKVTLKK
jgi:hypothetical protein